MNTQMLAVIKKDLRGITSNRRMVITLLIVPLVMTVFLPTVFVFIPYLAPEQGEDFRGMVEMLPLAETGEGMHKSMIRLILNYILPVFSDYSYYVILCDVGVVLCGRKGETDPGNSFIQPAFSEADFHSQGDGVASAEHVCFPSFFFGNACGFGNRNMADHRQRSDAGWKMADYYAACFTDSHHSDCPRVCQGKERGGRTAGSGLSADAGGTSAGRTVHGDSACQCMAPDSCGHPVRPVWDMAAEKVYVRFPI